MNEEDICENCGERRKYHIDYFETGKKNVCPHRKSMKFALSKKQAIRKLKKAFSWSATELEIIDKIMGKELI